MYYYLRCVLQVPIVNKYDAYGFGGHSIVKEYMNGDPDWGFISGANLNEIGFDDVEEAFNNDLKFDKNDVIYLLLNDLDLINRFIIKYQNDVKIINSKYYENKKTKKEVQMFLKSPYYKTPRIFEEMNVFPCFLKSNSHQDENYVINSIDEIENINLNKTYFEELINYNQERKLYFVYGNVFSKDNITVDQVDELICKDIASKLNLDIMSIDLLCNDQRYLIDVNPSPAFFESKESRECFVDIVFNYDILRI